jgi:hypothetical protein
VNSAVNNMGVQVSLLHPDLHSVEYVSRSSVSGTYGSSIFSVLRNVGIGGMYTT